MSSSERAANEQVRVYAKKLYMVPNEDGSHKFPASEICNKLWRRFGRKNLKVKPSRETIRLWCKKPNEFGVSWEDEYKQGVAASILTKLPKSKKLAKLTVEEAYDDEVARTLRASYKTNFESNKAVSKIQQLWLNSSMNELKQVAKKKHGGDVSKITKTEFGEVFSRDEMRLLLDIKKDSDMVLDKIRNNAAFSEQNVDKTIEINFKVG